MVEYSISGSTFLGCIEYATKLEKEEHKKKGVCKEEEIRGGNLSRGEWRHGDGAIGMVLKRVVLRKRDLWLRRGEGKGGKGG